MVSPQAPQHGQTPTSAQDPSSRLEVTQAYTPAPRSNVRRSARQEMLSRINPNSPLHEWLNISLISHEAWVGIPRDQQERLATASPESLIEGLLERGLITRYQADRIRVGNTHGLVIGNYRILNRIGAGGMGVVFKAEQIKLHRTVALKMLTGGGGGAARLLERFWAESRAVAQLQHPNIVAAIDAGETPGPNPDDPPIPYFVMELLEGRDLEELVIQDGPLDIAQSCRIMSQAADALAEAHRNKLIHRDIKPSNVFVNAKGQAKLLDFGLSRQKTQRLTIPGMMLGTIGYMAPEQARDPRSVDERADLYSLGCTMYWSLTGRHPFDDSDSINPFAEPEYEGLQPLRSLRPDVPIELDDIIRRLMSEEPEHRYRDAVSVYRALLPFIPEHKKVESVAPLAESGAQTRRPVLLVDDSPTVRYMCMQALTKAGFECVEVGDAGAALEMVQRRQFDLMLLDYQLPDMPGSEVLKRVREAMSSESLKVIVMSGMRDTADLAPLRLLGADDCITKPFTSLQLLTIIRAILNLKDKQDHTQQEAKVLAAENTRLKNALATANTELIRTRDFLVQSLGELIGERTYVSGNRSLRLQRYCRSLSEEASRHPCFRDDVSPDFRTLLELWVPLMDLGLLLLPDHLLMKPGELEPDERELMQGHTSLGADLLARIASKQPGQMGFFHMAITIARYHHERYDGSGYPDQLTGFEIPLPARFAAVADVYDALRCRRVFRPAMSHLTAVHTLMENSPGQFDPNLLQVFLRCHHQFDQIFRELPE